MLNLKIKEPDYKALYFEAMESKRQLQARHDKQIAGYKARNTILESDRKKLNKEVVKLNDVINSLMAE